MQKELSKAERNDIRTLIKFVEVFCREKHEGEKEPFLPKQGFLKDLMKKVSFCVPIVPGSSATPSPCASGAPTTPNPCARNARRPAIDRITRGRSGK